MLRREKELTMSGLRLIRGVALAMAAMGENRGSSTFSRKSEWQLYSLSIW
jgi:hypothetical protein